MPIGYRMGKLALDYLGLAKEPDHSFFVSPESGECHPQTCMMDGLQIATGTTYGKVMIAKTFYAKLAATFYHPIKGAVRYSLLPDSIDAMGKFEFFVYRKKGIEPSLIPLEVRREVIQWVYDQTDDDIFKVERKPDITYNLVKGSFNKTKCSVCGEYFFDRFVADSHLIFDAPIMDLRRRNTWKHCGTDMLQSSASAMSAACFLTSCG
jgi:formylmethanofuran dehydrogenase subunit E